MPVVPAAIVEATWRDVASLDPDAARALMERTAERQPALLAYVLGATARSSDAAQGLAVYLYYVLLAMFERTAATPIPSVAPARVEHHAERNETLLDRLAPAAEPFWERVAGVEASAQPFVVKYLVEALFEGDQSDDEERPSDDEVGLLYLTLKTVVDVLDEACEASSQ